MEDDLSVLQCLWLREYNVLHYSDINSKTVDVSSRINSGEHFSANDNLQEYRVLFTLNTELFNQCDRIIRAHYPSINLGEFRDYKL